jgi:hypothetical protein
VIEAIYGTRDSVEIEALITYESGDTGVIRRNLGIKEVR